VPSTPGIASDAAANVSPTALRWQSSTNAQTSDSQPFATFLLELTTANQMPGAQSEPATQQASDAAAQQDAASQQPGNADSQSDAAAAGQSSASSGETAGSSDGFDWFRLSNVSAQDAAASGRAGQQAASAEASKGTEAIADLPASPQQLIAKYSANAGAFLARLRNSRIADGNTAGGSASGTAATTSASPAADSAANAQTGATAQTGTGNGNDGNAGGDAAPVIAAEAAATTADDQDAAPIAQGARSWAAKHAADSSDGATDAAGNASTAPAQTVAAQPVAAAFVLNSETTSTSATPAANMVIGAETYARSKGSAGRVNGRDAAVTQPASEDTAAGNTATAGTPSASGATADSNAGVGSTQVLNGTPAQSAPDATDTPVSPLQADAGTPPGDAAATLRAGPTSLASAEGGDAGRSAALQPASDTANTANTALSNFGVLAGATPTAQTAASAAGGTTAANATVPVSGLPVAIAARAQAGSNQFDIRLDPPELGRIDVRLDVDSNGQVTSHITADRQDTLNLLQSQQPQLQHALEQAGLKTADNGLQFSLRDQSSNGQYAGNNNTPQPAASQLTIPDSDLPPVETTQVYSRYSLGGGLDIRV
jgi:flagellar hook-length control protein FliK